MHRKINFLYDLKKELYDLVNIEMYDGEDGDLLGIINDIDFTLTTTINHLNDVEKNIIDELMCIRKQMQNIEDNLSHGSEHTLEFIEIRRSLDINLI